MGAGAEKLNVPDPQQRHDHRDVFDSRILAERTQQIGEIIDTVNGIASQSNINLNIGATNQQAYYEALQQGVTPVTILENVRELRARGVTIPLIIMGYINPLLAYGETFSRDAVEAGVDGLIVVDMPFGTYEESPNIAFRNAAKIMKETGCGAVKLEGGARMAETTPGEFTGLGGKVAELAAAFDDRGLGALVNQSRTIRLPVHVSDDINKFLKISRELVHEFNREPEPEEVVEEVPASDSNEGDD